VSGGVGDTHQQAESTPLLPVWLHSTVLGSERLENLRIWNSIWNFKPAKSETEHERSSVVLLESETRQMGNANKCKNAL
jgi:hypothetical protein